MAKMGNEGELGKLGQLGKRKDGATRKHLGKWSDRKLGNRKTKENKDS